MTETPTPSHEKEGHKYWTEICIAAVTLLADAKSSNELLPILVAIGAGLVVPNAIEAVRQVPARFKDLRDGTNDAPEYQLQVKKMVKSIVLGVIAAHSAEIASAIGSIDSQQNKDAVEAFFDSDGSASVVVEKAQWVIENIISYLAVAGAAEELVRRNADTIVGAAKGAFHKVFDPIGRIFTSEVINPGKTALHASEDAIFAIGDTIGTKLAEWIEKGKQTKLEIKSPIKIQNPFVVSRRLGTESVDVSKLHLTPLEDENLFVDAKMGLVYIRNEDGSYDEAKIQLINARGERVDFRGGHFNGHDGGFVGPRAANGEYVKSEFKKSEELQKMGYKKY